MQMFLSAIGKSPFASDGPVDISQGSATPASGQKKSSENALMESCKRRAARVVNRHSASKKKMALHQRGKRTGIARTPTRKPINTTGSPRESWERRWNGLEWLRLRTSSLALPLLALRVC